MLAAFYDTVEALSDCNDLHKVMETYRQVERPTISCCERVRKLTEIILKYVVSPQRGRTDGHTVLCSSFSR